MSYGQNLPWGLQPTRSLGAATWNGQVNSYLIKSGYANNIFKGDPVIVAGAGDAGGSQTGYLISIYNALGSNNFAGQATFGVFDGCSFITPTAVNPIDPASPGRQFWPSGTLTLNNIPAVAYVVDDPNTVFNVQTSTNPGALQGNVGNGAPYVWAASPPIGGIIQGNTITGTSSLAIGAMGTGADPYNTIVIGIVPSPPNPSTPGAAFNNVEVLIQNHQYTQRAPIRT